MHPRQPYSISSLEINRVSATRNATFWMFFRVLDSSWQAVSNIGHLEPDNCPSTENALGMQYLEFLFIREINKQSKDKEIFCYAKYLLKYFLGRKLLTINNLTVMIF